MYIVFSLALAGRPRVRGGGKLLRQAKPLKAPCDHAQASLLEVLDSAHSNWRIAATIKAATH